MSVLVYLLAGAAIGAGTGVPIGAVGVAVVDAACRSTRGRAIAVAIGGGVGDLLYSGIGVLVLGRVLSEHAGAPRVLYAVSGVALIVFGTVVLRARPPAAPARRDSARDTRRGFWLGFGLVMMNPSSLITWVVIVGGTASSATSVEGVALVVGIGLGSVGWFVFLAHAARRGARRLGDSAAWIPRVAAVFPIAYGVFSLGRAARGFW